MVRRLFPLLCATALVAACGVKEAANGPDAGASEAADMTPEGPSLLSKLVGGGKPMPLDVQVPHANGLILQVDSLQAKPTETVINATIINGDDRENALNQYGNDDTYIVGADGSKLYLSPPAANEKLNIPAGQRMQAELVFLGRLSPDGPATLIVNDGDDTGNQYTDTPGFRIPLAIQDAAFSDDGSKKKLSSSRIVGEIARSRLGLAPAAAGVSSSSALTTSTVSSLEAIKSELGATETARGTVIALPGDVLFDFDKAEVRADARPVLDKLAQLIASGDAKIAIEGHTDSKGNDGYNLKLSERRAQAVRDYLKDVRSVAGDRMTVKGIGEAKPVAQNMTPDGKDNPGGQQKNRRVEVIIGKA